MKPLTLTFIAALIAAVTGMLWSQPFSKQEHKETTSITTLQEMQSDRSAELPSQDFDDRSLVFPRETQR